MEETLESIPEIRPLGGISSETAAVSEALSLTDEEAARRARDQYREGGIPALRADDRVSPHLHPGEYVVGLRPDATVTRIEQTGDRPVRADGALYVTNHRLLQIGDRLTSIPLNEIAELAMADQRILVTLTDARGVMLDVADPRQLRVLLAAAKSALPA